MTADSPARARNVKPATQTRAAGRRSIRPYLLVIAPHGGDAHPQADMYRVAMAT
ncbi:MAG TPA: hypothetical protein VFI34_09140 [Candidatus Limnocylindrales bacterium]|nr:hypothetical protein [Candidatus Limnocylindrales bacterium]